MSMSVSTPALPDFAGYTLRWSGPALVIQTDSWQKKWLCDIQIDETQKLGLKQVVRDLRPPALIVDLTDVPMLSAMCGTMLVILAKEMDAIQHPGRMAIVGATPPVLEYLRITQLFKLFDLPPTEAAAMERIEKLLADSQFVAEVPRETKYFTFENRDGVCVVTVQSGLFDQMPEIESAWPTYTELRNDFRAGWPTPVPTVLLDVRSAGIFNHRTMNLMAQFSQMVTKAGGRMVVCIPADTIRLWQVCKFDKVVAPYFTEPAEALTGLRESVSPESITSDSSSTVTDT